MTKRITPLLIALAMALAPAAASAQDAASQYRAGTPVTITNPNGNVSVRGVTGSKVTATAKYVDSGAPADVDVSGDGATFNVRPRRNGRGGEVALDVVLPSNARIGLVEARSGNVTVTGISNDVRVVASSGNVRLDGVGSANVRCSSGDVTILNVAGAALVESSSGSMSITSVGGNLTANCRSGNVTVRDVGGNVETSVGSGNFTIEKLGGSIRVAAISGNVRVTGGGGNANVNTASGNILLDGVEGSVDATTSSGNVEFRGQIRPGLRYRLKSHSGNATLRACGNVAGFVVTMQSYSGEIETAFPIKIDQPATMTRSLTGRYGDGSAEVEVAAFSGSAKLLMCETGMKKRNGRTK